MKEQIVDDYKYIVTTLNEIKSYVTCPLLYYLRYVAKWKYKGRNIATLEEILLMLIRDTIRYYFRQLGTLSEIIEKPR